MSEFNELLKKVKEFRDQRDWKQFHDPKNLSEAIIIESSELLENFLWKTTQHSKKMSPDKLNNIKEELADIFIYLLYMSDVLNIDLLKEVENKIRKNGIKYSIEKSKGKSAKYNEAEL